jgi:hypothetical protein
MLISIGQIIDITYLIDITLPLKEESLHVVLGGGKYRNFVASIENDEGRHRLVELII